MQEAPIMFPIEAESGTHTKKATFFRKYTWVLPSVASLTGRSVHRTYFTLTYDAPLLRWRTTRLSRTEREFNKIIELGDLVTLR